MKTKLKDIFSQQELIFLYDQHRFPGTILDKEIRQLYLSDLRELSPLLIEIDLNGIIPKTDKETTFMGIALDLIVQRCKKLNKAIF